MTNIFSDAASNEEVDTDYVQSELDTVVDTFTEDYETYYAEIRKQINENEAASAKKRCGFAFSG